MNVIERAERGEQITRADVRAEIRQAAIIDVPPVPVEMQEAFRKAYVPPLAPGQRSPFMSPPKSVSLKTSEPCNVLPATVTIEREIELKAHAASAVNKELLRVMEIGRDAIIYMANSTSKS
jgi:hypothetical protein